MLSRFTRMSFKHALRSAFVRVRPARRHITRRRARSALMALLAASVLMTAPASTRAEMPVIDPANLAQSILQVSHLVSQLKNQVRQIEQATAMLKQNPLQLSPELQASLHETEALFEEVEGIAFEARALSEQVRALYPDTFEDFQLDQIAAQSDRWLGESRASLTRAMRAEALAAQSVAQSRDGIARALQSSGDAEGQTGAIQASNQLLGVQASQLTEVHALLAAQGRALEVERMERLARETRAREIQRRAFPSQHTTSPAPARSAFRT